MIKLTLLKLMIWTEACHTVRWLKSIGSMISLESFSAKNKKPQKRHRQPNLVSRRTPHPPFSQESFWSSFWGENSEGGRVIRPSPSRPVRRIVQLSSQLQECGVYRLIKNKKLQSEMSVLLQSYFSHFGTGTCTENQTWRVWKAASALWKEKFSCLCLPS